MRILHNLRRGLFLVSPIFLVAILFVVFIPFVPSIEKKEGLFLFTGGVESKNFIVTHENEPS